MAMMAAMVERTSPKVVISPAMTANVAELIPFLSNVPLPLAAGFTAFYAGFCSGDSATFP